MQPIRLEESAKQCLQLPDLAEARERQVPRLRGLHALSRLATLDRTVLQRSAVRQARLAAFRQAGGPLSQAAPDKRGILAKEAAEGAETTMASELPVALVAAAAGVAPAAAAAEQAWRLLSWKAR